MSNPSREKSEPANAAERKKEIIELLERGNAVKVTELSKRFKVTEETVRRDLERLENEG